MVMAALAWNLKPIFDSTEAFSLKSLRKFEGIRQSLRNEFEM
jgi:hypothetical protein